MCDYDCPHYISGEDVEKLRAGYYGHPMSVDFVEILAAEYGLNMEPRLADVSIDTEQVCWSSSWIVDIVNIDIVIYTTIQFICTRLTEPIALYKQKSGGQSVQRITYYKQQ